MILALLVAMAAAAAFIVIAGMLVYVDSRAREQGYVTGLSDAERCLDKHVAEAKREASTTQARAVGKEWN